MQWKQAVSSLVLCLLAGASPAATLGAVHLTDVQWSLADLDPNDGIDPLISWMDLSSTAGVWAHFPGDLADDASGIYGWGDQSLTLKGASVWMTSTEMHVAADATEAALILTRSEGVRSGRFVLSPQTQITLTANVKAEISENGQFGLNSLRGLVAIKDDDDMWSPWLIDDIKLDSKGSVSKSLLVAFRNDSDNAAKGTLNYQADVYFDNRVAVPEPGVWMMALAGLSVSAAAGRLGRRQV